MVRPRLPIGTQGAPWFEASSGRSVLAVVRFREADGRIRKIKASGRSKAEATRRLNQKIATKSATTAHGTDELTADSLFGDLATAWIESLAATDRLAASTRYRYERDMRTLVLPAFQYLALREITVRRVDLLLKELYQRSYDRAQKAKVVLNLAFKLAVRWEVLDRNPVRDVETLHRPPRQAKALSLDTVQLVRAQVAQWQQAADGKPGPKPDGQILCVIETMLGTSARIGEVLALRRCDVDLEGDVPSVRIAGTIVSLDKGRTFRQDHPKTSRSARTVAIPEFTAAALSERLRRIGDVAPEHLVFFTRNGTPITTNNFRRTLRSIVKGTAAQDVTPHAFRRTVATTIDRVVGIDLAAELLGHTSTEITRVHYIEPNQFVDSSTAAILQEALGPAAKALDARAARASRRTAEDHQVERAARITDRTGTGDEG